MISEKHQLIVSEPWNLAQDETGFGRGVTQGTEQPHVVRIRWSSDSGKYDTLTIHKTCARIAGFFSDVAKELQRSSNNSEVPMWVQSSEVSDQ